MQKRLIKYVFLLFALILINHKSEAKKVSGFIITENLDTIYGEIKVSKFDLLTGELIICGINLEPLHLEVYFRSYEKRRFKRYQAKNISGFGFDYKSTDYVFRSFVLESNTPFINEKRRDRFLQLNYVGNVSLYKDLSRMIYDNSVRIFNNINSDQSFIYYDYFLFNKNKGLTKVEITKDIQTINDLLYLYDFEQEFVEGLPINTKLKDIKMILMNYELWFDEKESKIIKV